jgi:hypothetical protein
MTEVNWTNFTDFGDLPSLANTASNGIFWSGMLYMLWIIILLILIAYGFEVALMVSSFIALIIGLLLVYSDLIAWYHCITFVGIILFVVLYNSWGRK